MNKAFAVLAVLCSFLLGVVAGPWLAPLNPRNITELPAPAEQTPVAQPTVPPLPTAGTQPANEPELALKGVFVSADSGRSRALIALGDDPPVRYRVEQKLPIGFVLKSVGPKSVEIAKDGDTRTLLIQRSKSGPESASLAEADTSGNLNPAPEAPASASTATPPDIAAPSGEKPAATSGENPAAQTSP
ncbi:MAG: type II secretion system protein N [Nevskiales bacterium]